MSQKLWKLSLALFLFLVSLPSAQAIGIYTATCKVTYFNGKTEKLHIEGFWQNGIHPPVNLFHFPKTYNQKLHPPACYVSALSACYVYAYALKQIDDAKDMGSPRPRIDYKRLSDPKQQFFIDELVFETIYHFLTDGNITTLNCHELPDHHIPDPKWWGRPYPALDVWLDEHGIDIDPYTQLLPETKPFIDPNILPKTLPYGITAPKWWQPAMEWMQNVIDQINDIGKMIQEHAWKLLLFQIALGLVIAAILEISTIALAVVGFAKLLAALAMIVGICQSIGIDFQFTNPSFTIPNNTSASLSLNQIYEDNKEEIQELIQNIEQWKTIPVHFQMKVGKEKIDLNLKEALRYYRSSDGLKNQEAGKEELVTFVDN